MQTIVLYLVGNTTLEPPSDRRSPTYRDTLLFLKKSIKLQIKKNTEMVTVTARLETDQVK